MGDSVVTSRRYSFNGVYGGLRFFFVSVALIPMYRDNGSANSFSVLDFPDLLDFLDLLVNLDNRVK